MTRGVRHVRNNRVVARSASRSASQGSARTGNASQRTSVAAAPQQVEPPKKRGRKPGSQTKLAMPKQGVKVALVPSGDQQFSYVNYKPPYLYTSQVGVILRREYPGLVQDKDENGTVIGDPRPALDWSDYFLSTPNELGITSGDRVTSEFWRLFEVTEDKKLEADCVLDTYLLKRVDDLMYQARVDAVKAYYDKKGQTLDDTLARPIVLQFEQYMEGRLPWCNEEVWPELCRHWCSEDFLSKRKQGQSCRLGSDDNAQNHGGSRPFTETQQVLEARFGREKATPLNVYAVMKSGINSIDSNGSSGPIKSRKAQKRLDDYIVGVRSIPRQSSEDEEHEHMEVEGDEEGEEEPQRRQEPEQEQQLNGKVLYDMAGGTPHGRFPIANGAIRAADVRAAAKDNRPQASKSASMQTMAREMARLRRANERLERENCAKNHALQESKVAIELTLGLYQELGKEIPNEALQRLSAVQAIATGSSHVASQSTHNSHNGEDFGDTNVDNIRANNQGSGNMQVNGSIS